jgi:hypothetical protein
VRGQKSGHGARPSELLGTRPRYEPPLTFGTIEQRLDGGREIAAGGHSGIAHHLG